MNDPANPKSVIAVFSPVAQTQAPVAPAPLPVVPAQVPRQAQTTAPREVLLTVKQSDNAISVSGFTQTFNGSFTLQAPIGKTLTLAVVATRTYPYYIWSGCDAGNNQPQGVCTVIMNAQREITLRSSQYPYSQSEQTKSTLTVLNSGSGSGHILADIQEVCTVGAAGKCERDLPLSPGEKYTSLIALPDANSVFVSWSGPCTLFFQNLCRIQLDTGKTVSVVFAPKPSTFLDVRSFFLRMLAAATSTWNLKVEKSGTGNGIVFDDSKKISCGETCSASYDNDELLTLSAVSAGDTSFFGGWTGPCNTVYQNLCRIQVNGNKTITANFTLNPAKVLFPLTVNMDGIGTVTSDPTGIQCGSVEPSGSVCEKEFSIGETVVLKAVARPGSPSVFSRWSGACANVKGNVCTVLVDAAKTVTATFAYPPLQSALFLSVRIEGQGIVTADDEEITCGLSGAVQQNCARAYIYGTTLSLVANPAPSSQFFGWGSGCATIYQNLCRVMMDADKTITATFREIPQKKTLTVVSYGPGSVKSATGGIICPSDCAKEYDKGSAVTLTPVPQAGATFLGWKGACKGQEPCAVSLERARFVYARFRLVNATLSAAKKGFGTVTSIPAGLVCGNVCSVPYPTDMVVTLYATPLKGQTFARWEGADECKGTEPRCTVQMGIDRSVTAVFLPSSSF
ncbi:MAG: hypothetical protein HYU05_01515 [Candidatus Wildermuthbacteria bacterium]|nr:hypothetical protein [Candidatus Wildermuthbacteria bacterium]